MNSRTNNTALYKTLQVSPKSTYAEIKRAFHKKAKELSPDRHLNHPNWKAVNEKFAYLVFAHNVLKSVDARGAYDADGFNGLRRIGFGIPSGFADFKDPFPSQPDNAARLERVKAKLARDMKLLEDYWAKRMEERLRLQEETREAFRVATYKQIVQIAWKKEILNERRRFLSSHGFDLRI